MTESTVAPLLAAAQAAVDLLRGLRLPAVIVGGFAVAVRGRPRITQDIDLVTLAELTVLPDLADAAVRAGFSLRRPDAVEFARTTRVLLLRHEPSGIDIDISLGALPFERELVERATPVRILDRELPIARGDDLVIMKSLALRPRDVADIEGMLELADDLDLARVRRVVAEFTEALEDADFSAELEAILRRAKRK